MPSKTFPPKFDSSIKYPAIYNLDELEVFQEAESGVYFDIKQLQKYYHLENIILHYLLMIH